MSVNFLIEVLETGFVVTEIEQKSDAGQLDAIAVIKQSGSGVKRFAAETPAELANIIARVVQPTPPRA